MTRSEANVASLFVVGLVLAFVVSGQPGCSDPWAGYAPDGDEQPDGQRFATCDGFEAVAHGEIRISKNADFSTNDLEFTSRDTLHLEVCSSAINLLAIKKQDLEVKAQDVKVKTKLVNDGEIFKAAVELSSFAVLVGSQQGELKVKLEDQSGRKLATSLPITLVGDALANQDAGTGDGAPAP